VPKLTLALMTNKINQRLEAAFLMYHLNLQYKLNPLECKQKTLKLNTYKFKDLEASNGETIGFAQFQYQDQRAFFAHTECNICFLASFVRFSHHSPTFFWNFFTTFRAICQKIASINLISADNWFNR
jgi:hypothetical protein